MIEIWIDFMRLAAAVGIAFGAGRLISKPILAVLLAKKGFEWAEELYQSKEERTA